MRFYNREKETKILKENESQSKRSAVFTVLMGRKRVGKTTLIKTALKDCKYAYLLITDDSEEVLCQHLKQTLEEQLGIHFDGAANQFCNLFEVVMKESLNRHFTIVLDEFQTLQKVNPAIFRTTKKLWDKYHNYSYLHLITVCSIQPPTRHIFEDTNGQFYGRPSTILILKPFFYYSSQTDFSRLLS
ncbi:MAG: AAA family ATPase [Prevotella sp.]|nr:AAA family ATPase [Prevotella sp.]